MAETGRAAIAELERLEAHEGLARAWKLMMYVHFYEGRFSPAEECVTSALRHAELAHDRVFEVRLLSALASCLVYSATSAAEALERCGDLLERGAGDRRTEAMTLSAMSHLEAMRGEAEAAREHYRRSRAMLTDLGFTLSAAITSLHSGPAEVLAGDLDRAEAELRADYDTLQAMGDTGYTPTVAALLAEVLHAQGRDREAGELADVCREKASPQDVGAQYQWRSIQARLLAAEGRTAEAEALARESVRLISTTDQPDVQGQALAGLAEVLEAAGKRSRGRRLAAGGAGALRDQGQCGRGGPHPRGAGAARRRAAPRACRRECRTGSLSSKAPPWVVAARASWSAGGSMTFSRGPDQGRGERPDAERAPDLQLGRRPPR